MNYIIVALMTAIFLSGLIYINHKKRLFEKNILYIPLTILMLLIIYVEIVVKKMNISFAILLFIAQAIVGVLALWDIKEKKIPVLIIYFLFLICAVMLLINPYCGILNNILTGVFISIGFFAAYKIGKGGIGLGDAEVISALAFGLGFSGLFGTMFCALFLSMLYGIGLMIFKKAKIKTEIPFMPFLFLGLVLNIINF